MAEDRKGDAGMFERTGESVGETAGRLAGKATDMAMSATGAVFDSMASMLGSWWSGGEAKGAADRFDETRDQECRQHFEMRSGGRDYATTRPLYQFGHVARQNPEYRNRSFSEVEPELRQAWESGPGRQHGGWDEVRAYVDFGYGSGSRGPGGGGDLGRTGGV